MRKLKSGGGWQAIRYTWRKGREVGLLNFWRAMNSKNACKTCAFGMGGQLGGMTNEARYYPEVCKKSLQAMAADMQGRIDPAFFQTYSIEQLKGLSPRELEMLGRLADPVIALPGATHFEPISWDDAFDLMGRELVAANPKETFFYSSGRSSNEAGFLLQLFARAYGTNHVSNCSYYCHQASGVGLKESIGSGTATISLEDLEKCDLLFLIGGNPASNHPRLMTMLMKMRRRGGRVVVVNPLKETGLVNFRVPSSAKSMLFGSEIASSYLQPTIGGDIALFAGIAKALIAKGQIASDFVQESTEGFEKLRSLVEALTWGEIVAGSGVSQAEIEAAAAEYARSEKTIFAWTMGITHHEHGVENVQWIANLALLRGMVGMEGAGLMPIRGHSNVQGLGSVGVSPAMSAAVLSRLVELGVPVPDFEGYDTLAALEAAGRGEMRFALCLGGNLYGASPDANFTGAALSSVDTVVYLSTTMNTGHLHGMGGTTLILPVLARDEEAQSTTQESMFNYVRLSDGGPARHEGPRSETSIIAELGKRAAKRGPLDWEKLSSHDEIRGLIAYMIPGFEQLADIGQTKKEFEIPGRVLHQAAFQTPSGRATFQAHLLPHPSPLGEGQLRLMTIRSEGQFNTVVYEEEDIYRAQDRRNVILMNRDDMAAMGLVEDQPVTVSSAAGGMHGILAREFEIARGCAAMYYPEANVLVPKTSDPRSKTPAYKSVLVDVQPEQDSTEFSTPVETLAHAAASRDNMRAC